MKKEIHLDLGCGKNKFKDYFIGIDISPNVMADIVMDVTKKRLPFDDLSVTTIRSSHFLEHLSKEELIFLMNECWRVLKWGGKIWHEVPHADCDLAKQDPTHKNSFVQSSMKFFCGEYLIKHSLDYGINCIFFETWNGLNFPSGEKPENKKYCTMIKFGLLKDQKHFEKFKNEFPFNKKQNRESKNIPNPTWFKDTGWKTEHNIAFSDVLKRVAKRAINEHISKIMEIKIDASKRYGTDPAPLGAKGLFADINRKFVRLKRWLWDDEKYTSENIRNTCYDLAVYAILTVMLLDEKENKGE